MRITFGVFANHCGQLNRNIFESLRITFGRLRITFQMDSQNPFLRKFHARGTKVQINCASLRINLKSDSQFFGEYQKIANHFFSLKSRLSSLVYINILMCSKWAYILFVRQNLCIQMHVTSRYINRLYDILVLRPIGLATVKRTHSVRCKMFGHKV